MMLLEPSQTIDPPLPPQTRGGGDDEGGGGQEWVTVAHFGDVPSAHVARLRLESNGIHCFIADENIAATAWHYAIATGGVKVQVPRGDAARAAELLTRVQQPIPDSVDDNLRACPRCGCSELANNRFSPRRMLGLMFLAMVAASMHPLLGAAALVIGIVFLMTSRQRICTECGSHWREPPARGFDVIAAQTQDESRARRPDVVGAQTPDNGSARRSDVIDAAMPDQSPARASDVVDARTSDEPSARADDGVAAQTPEQP